MLITWVNNSLTTETYDGNNNQLTFLNQYWNVSAWVNSMLQTQTYDANNLQLSLTERNFDNTGTIVKSGDSSYYYFQTVLGINTIASQTGNISVYPNPSSGKFNIKLKNGEQGIENVEVFNVLGEEVYKKQFSTNNSQIAIELNQPSGVYFCRVIANTGELIGEEKIIVQK